MVPLRCLCRSWVHATHDAKEISNRFGCKNKTKKMKTGQVVSPLASSWFFIHLCLVCRNNRRLQPKFNSQTTHTRTGTHSTFLFTLIILFSLLSLFYLFLFGVFSPFRDTFAFHLIVAHLLFHRIRFTTQTHTHTHPFTRTYSIIHRKHEAKENNKIV